MPSGGALFQAWPDVQHAPAAENPAVVGLARYKIGPEKGAILDSLVQLVQPKLVVELGSFVGYSAVRTARLLQPGQGKVVCVEANSQCVVAIKGVVAHAGLSDRVVVEAGLSSEVVGKLASKYGQAQLFFEVSLMLVVDASQRQTPSGASLLGSAVGSRLLLQSLTQQCA